MVKELHNVGHWGKQAMINLIKGGHLTECVLTEKDVSIYFEIRPACLPCLANMTQPPSVPHHIPSGTKKGCWWEMDGMFVRGSWYGVFVEALTGQLLIEKFKSASRPSMKICAEKFQAVVDKKFPEALSQGVTLVLDRQPAFVEFGEIKGVSLLQSFAEGHTNRAKAAIKKVQTFYRAKMEELPYELPVELDEDCLNFYAKMRKYVPGLIDEVETQLPTK